MSRTFQPCFHADEIVTEEQAIGESGSEREYDESSDEADVGASDKSGNYFQGEIGSSTTFLLGARSRFGRAIRFNNRLKLYSIMFFK